MKMVLGNTILKSVLTVTLGLVAILGHAQETTAEDGENLYLYTKLSTEAEVYSMDEISKITFSKKGIQIWNTNWPTEYAYSNVRVLKFSGKGFLLGDANNDNTIDRTDIAEIVAYLKNNPSGKTDTRRVDVNGDGVVNIADILSVVNLIVGTKP